MPPKIRYLEIDLARSLAVVIMVVYHLLYDLRMFYRIGPDPFSIGWIIVARMTAGLFLLLVGISFAISWERHRPHEDATTWRKKYPKYLRRGIVILCCGALVSLATYIADPQTYVRFGVLQLIGTAILLLPLFAQLRGWNAILGLAILATGFTTLPTTQTSLLLPLGFTRASFETVDYFPLLPWFGVILIGYAIGHTFYVRYPSWRTVLSTVHCPLITLLPGRFALWIYLLHQPLLLLVLFLLLERPS